VDSIGIYLIRIGAEVEEDEVNATGPLQIAVLEIKENTTLLSTCADQSGLIGLLRYLHGQGHVLLSFTRESTSLGERSVSH
jgi:hypothetical protein